MVGYYHSHPDHPSRPSDFDREHAWPGLSYLIVSVQKGRAADARSWRLADDRDRFDEETIEATLDRRRRSDERHHPHPHPAAALHRPIRRRSRSTGGTVGEAMQRPHPALPGPPAPPLHRRRRAAQLRQPLPQRRGRAPSREGETPLKDGDTLSIIPSIAGGACAARRRRPAGAADEIDELPELSPPEIRHYSRHLILPEVGTLGQRKLKAAKVLMIGAGGLGSPLGLYLAAAGVGTLGLVDFDVVDESNLHRQVLFGRSVGGAAEDPGRRRPPARPQPAHQGRPPRDAARLVERPGAVPGLRHRSSTAPTTSPPATWSTTPACCSASRTSTARSSASRGRCRSSGEPGGPATAACSPSRRRRGSSPRAPRAGCSACCRGSSARCRPTR